MGDERKNDIVDKIVRRICFDKNGCQTTVFWIILLIVCSALVAMLGGCANFCAHVDGNPVVYQGTRIGWDLLGSPFRCFGGDNADPITDSFGTLFWPFVVVDFPLEVVADTVTLPYDAWATHERKNRRIRETREGGAE